MTIASHLAGNRFFDTWPINSRREIIMKLEHRIRLIAGTFILLSLALGHWVNPNWYWFTAFVGANLIQSALTKWCLMEDILRKLNVAGPLDDASRMGGHCSINRT